MFTLLPGDVILTGTPAGVGPFGTVRVEISGIGTLRNAVRDALTVQGPALVQRRTVFTLSLGQVLGGSDALSGLATASVALGAGVVRDPARPPRRAAGAPACADA